MIRPDVEKRAVILLSGGLDSTTVLAIARAEGWHCHALTVNYGQIHEGELKAARRVAESLGVAEHRTLDLDLHSWGGSALVGDGAVPQDRDVSKPLDKVPSTYVPARNTIFLSLALAWAEVLDAEAISAESKNRHRSDRGYAKTRYHHPRARFHRG